MTGNGSSEETLGEYHGEPICQWRCSVLGIGITESRHAGVLVTGVMANSAAQRAGIQRGDLIIQVNENRVKSGSALLYELNHFRPGADGAAYRGARKYCTRCEG